jgi:hypothetical protein
LGSSVRLARERIRRAPRRVLATWVLQAFVLLIMGRLLPGVYVEDLI